MTHKEWHSCSIAKLFANDLWHAGANRRFRKWTCHSTVCNGVFYIRAHKSKKHESKDYILGQFHKLHTTHLMNVP